MVSRDLTQHWLMLHYYLTETENSSFPNCLEKDPGQIRPSSVAHRTQLSEQKVGLCRTRLSGREAPGSHFLFFWSDIAHSKWLNNTRMIFFSKISSGSMAHVGGPVWVKMNSLPSNVTCNLSYKYSLESLPSHLCNCLHIMNDMMPIGLLIIQIDGRWYDYWLYLKRLLCWDKIRNRPLSLLLALKQNTMS